jgi:acyl-CoA reductase-like NAD-dependent aldehyde dehydrogenase
MPGMLIDGLHVGHGRQYTDVRDPYRGVVLDSVPIANPRDIERALAAAASGAREMAKLPGHRRAEILDRAAEIVAVRTDALAELITREEGKPLSESLGEVRRIPDLLRLCGFEGTQIRGESLPLDAHAGATGKLGIVARIPAGVIVAITPFNYPMLLVVHKIGPALAAGNAVILKPASATPLTALALCDILLEAGLPPRGLQCLTGPGGTVGMALAADPRVRMVTFTGSSGTGKEVSRSAAGKKTSLELGSNCPMVILEDADIEAASSSAAVGGYVNAGQVCISVQRAIVVAPRYGDFTEALVEKVRSLKVGDPFVADTKVAAMINEREAERVRAWIAEASGDGATVAVGGERSGAVMAPTVIAGVEQGMRIAEDELFGPAIAVMRARDADQAIAMANSTPYGLGASVFTTGLAAALDFAARVEAGTVMINASPQWRADLMPYGGLRGSGFGREGPRYAVQEMTEVKTVVFHGLAQ